MRLSTDADRDEERALETLSAALRAGANLLDTAPSYGQGESDTHHNERLIAGVVAGFEGDRSRVKIATKGGMTRTGTAWIPDGRTSTLRAQCEASLRALGVSAIDLYQLHAPDPRTPLATSVRALEALRREGYIRAIGLCNVTTVQLEQAVKLTPIESVQVALGAFDDRPFRSGLVARAAALGVRVLAHSPLGGPKRARSLSSDRELCELADKYRTTAGSIVLAWLYGLGGVVPLPGCRRPETAVQAVVAAATELEAVDREKLDRRFAAGARAVGRLSSVPVDARGAQADAEIVIAMGIQGAGKSSYVQRFVESGYERLNRDLRGGSLLGLAKDLRARIDAGGTRFVLDNTYTTRVQRSHVIDVARDHGIRARCIWLDTPLEAAQLNATLRLYERYGRLPEPEELRQLGRKDSNAFRPNVQFRAARELEPPSAEEGFESIEVVPFERRKDPRADRAGLVVAWEAWQSADSETLKLFARRASGSKVCIFAWAGTRPASAFESELAALAERVDLPHELALCAHEAGPPQCWCRPPLPGLIVPWLLREQIDPERSLLVGTGPAHRRLAQLFGFGYLELPDRALP